MNHSRHLPRRLSLLLDHVSPTILSKGLKGIEKESLRIGGDGFIAQTPHPAALGSPLTHPYITTDYSEALLEFITPPFSDIKATLAYLHNIHQFVYDNLEREMLLAASMPCGISGDDSIPIAEYGSSNIGCMKHIYRRGLGYRYGRTMQAIAGIHFNYSVAPELWPQLHEIEKSKLSLDQFIADGYFALIRNLQRQGWMILYLFGASPAICKSFFKSRSHVMAEFEEFDRYTLFHPYATSLRMSDIGYKSENQASLKIDYNSLAGYVESLGRAISTPFPEYEKIGVKVNGEYRQLNSNILQIENEFYSTVRPKQIARSGEKPTLALKRRGVRYVELRSLDLDLFCPIGIQQHTACFVEAFILNCLFQQSPWNDDNTRQTNNSNQLAVAHRGREPGLMLDCGGSMILLRDWAERIIEDMRPLCELLDRDRSDKPYTAALEHQHRAVLNPDLTPSAGILFQMLDRNQPFAPYALRISAEHENYFRQQKLSDDLAFEFMEMSRTSIANQREKEKNDDLSFDDFLARYFSQQ
ncbi:MAG: glutamate--cysteine ligase [Gammaproteobacteria bacterium]